MNAALGNRYLLTADHCFTDKNEISDFEYWLLIFNYQTSCGNDTAPPFTEIVQVELEALLRHCRSAFHIDACGMNCSAAHHFSASPSAQTAFNVCSADEIGEGRKLTSAANACSMDVQVTIALSWLGGP